GSPYFHAGFRAFADPEIAARYRLEPTSPLRAGDTVHWPARPARVRRWRRGPSPSNFSAWTRSGLRGQRRRAHVFSVGARKPMHLDVRGQRGASVSFTIGPASSGSGSVIGIESDVPSRTANLLRAHLEAEARDWARFLSCGIQPLSSDPQRSWLQERRGLVD